MTEQEIYDKILDCQDLLDKIHEKDKVVTIKGIVDRYNKYSRLNKPIDMTTINNAILENKLKNTIIQILILEKINQMNLPSDYQEIYTNLPNRVEESATYITNLSESLELVSKCHNLIIEMERLFETSEYAHIINYYSNLYQYTVNNGINNIEYSRNMINTYLNNLTLEQKQALYFEALSLCYNRNVFNYTSQLVIRNRMNNDSLLTDNKVAVAYQINCQLLMISILNNLFEEKSLAEIYETINEVHNSKKVKSLIRKKQV